MFDTIIDDLPADMFPDRPWGPGNDPKTAVREFLKSHSEFEIDRSIQDKLQNNGLSGRLLEKAALNGFRRFDWAKPTRLT